VASLVDWFGGKGGDLGEMLQRLVNDSFINHRQRGPSPPDLLRSYAARAGRVAAAYPAHGDRDLSITAHPQCFQYLQYRNRSLWSFYRFLGIRTRT